MKNPLKHIFASTLIGNLGICTLFLFSTPVFGQKHSVKTDSIAIHDSIKEMMFQGALLSIDALQSKYESEKRQDLVQKQQKAGESQNLFYQSRACYRKAIAFDKNYYPAWNNMGTTYYLQDLPKSAVPCYKHAISINGNYASAWFNLGKAYEVLGKKDSALYSFEQCIRSDSSTVSAYQELSRIVMSTSKDTSMALSYLRLAARNKPTSEVPWVSMSTIYFSLGDSVSGIAATENAAKIYRADVVRLQLLINYFQNHSNTEKVIFYSGLLAVENKKQEIPADFDPEK